MEMRRRKEREEEKRCSRAEGAASKGSKR